MSMTSEDGRKSSCRVFSLLLPSNAEIPLCNFVSYSFQCCFQGFIKRVDHCLGRFHIAHDVFDVVRGAVLAVPVRADPQIGFIVGVVSLVILSSSCRRLSGSPFRISTLKPKSCPAGVYCRNSNSVKPGRLASVSTLQPKAVATLVICSVVVIVSVFLSLRSMSSDFARRGCFHVRSRTGDARTTGKETEGNFMKGRNPGFRKVCVKFHYR